MGTENGQRNATAGGRHCEEGRGRVGGIVVVVGGGGGTGCRTRMRCVGQSGCDAAQQDDDEEREGEGASGRHDGDDTGRVSEDDGGLRAEWRKKKEEGRGWEEEWLCGIMMDIFDVDR